MAYDEFFGKLLMPTTPEAAGTAALWSDILLYRIIGVLFLFLTLLSFGDIVDILSSIKECFTLNHGHLHLEHNRSKARTRNRVAWLFSIPFAMMVDRFGVFQPDFITQLPPSLSFPTLYGMLLAYAGFRGVLYLLIPSKLRGEEKAAAVQVPYTYFIILTITMLVTCGLGICFGGRAEAIRGILRVETGLVFLVSLVKTGQIFSGVCGVFSTILYLCALEIVPAGVFIASTILL